MGCRSPRVAPSSGRSNTSAAAVPFGEQSEDLRLAESMVSTRRDDPSQSAFGSPSVHGSRVHPEQRRDLPCVEQPVSATCGHLPTTPRAEKSLPPNSRLAAALVKPQAPAQAVSGRHADGCRVGPTEGISDARTGRAGPIHHPRAARTITDRSQVPAPGQNLPCWSWTWSPTRTPQGPAGRGQCSWPRSSEFAGFGCASRWRLP